MRIYTTLLLALMAVAGVSHAAEKTNIVLERYDMNYTFVPEKGGDKVGQIVCKNEYKYRADRTAEEAVTAFYYSDNFKIEKVSGGQQSYRSMLDPNIFYSDSKGCLIRTELKKPGARADVSYQITMNRPELIGKFLIVPAYDAENVTCTMRVPDKLADKITFEVKNATPEVTTVDKGGFRTITYSFGPMAGAKTRYFNLPPSKPKTNLHEMKTEINLDPENEDIMHVKTSLRMLGTAKDFVSSLFTLDDVVGPMSEYFGRPLDKRVSSTDLKEELEEKKENSLKIAKILWDADYVDLDDYKVTEPGVLPGSPATKMELNGRVQGMTHQAGQNLMGNVGRFNAYQLDIKGAERKRDISVVRPAANQYRTEIRFNVPEGYTVAPESVEALNRSVVTPADAFMVKTKTEGNVVNVTVAERWAKSVYPAEAWPELLQILDALREFSSASIVLQKI